ncbi:pheA operon leader peptide PheL [Pantoea agglomerans]|nr:MULTISPECIES: pheA operon leader peptide PheL [Pantoea]MCH9408226.1 pheA operon leader peptide PheL [Pantoea agglomerans]MCP1205452.1 pheA operon leader peptide PheL [Pantoea sp. B550]MCT2419933.1 pheA operon leader peptide PheL [Pantoea sp. XY16]MCW0938706.1 pheA operon leader peptide PheL [Pantoea sp. RG18]MCX2907030.1 pheA operon leader peptide PheL [[Curtobacterium] plantarum]
MKPDLFFFAFFFTFP